MENNSDNHNHGTEPESKSVFEPVGSMIWDVVKVVLLSLIVVVVIRGFIAQPFVVSGSSMEPTYSDRDYLIINEIDYRFADPARGDVVVFRFPGDPDQFFIKRVIGLPGETVEINNSRVIIFNADTPQGERLDEPYLATGTQTKGDMKVDLAENQYFLLGDNRSSSSDSRVWGPLREDYIVGKVWVRLLPLARASWFEKPQYSIP